MYSVCSNNIYFAKNHSKIILFDTREEAQKFVQDFFNYATMRIGSNPEEMGLFFEIGPAMQNVVIEEWKHGTENTINFSEIKKKEG